MYGISALLVGGTPKKKETNRKNPIENQQHCSCRNAETCVASGTTLEPFWSLLLLVLVRIPLPILCSGLCTRKLA